MDFVLNAAGGGDLSVSDGSGLSNIGSSFGAGSASGSGNEHLDRRNQYKQLYSSLRAEDLENEECLQRVQASMCDTWSEIRKDSSKALRARVQVYAAEISSSTIDKLFSIFLPSLKLHAHSPGTRGAEGEEGEGSGLSGQCWQRVHGNLLGVFALIPLLGNYSTCNTPNSAAGLSSPQVLSERVECVKDTCLEALSHPQLPVREVARSCLHDLGQHVGSLGKTFLRKCLERIGLLAESDVAAKTEVHASELDGLLHYVGRMVSAEAGLLLGSLDGDDDHCDTGIKLVSAIIEQVHLSMQHSSSTVRQRAAYVAVECVSSSDGNGSKIGNSKSDDFSEQLSGQAEYLNRTVDTIIEVLAAPDEDWRVLEGYMLVTESLLLQLLAASVAKLRLKAGLGLGGGALGDVAMHRSFADVQFAVERLVDPLIQHVDVLTRHSSFEVRRIFSQLMPSLARAVLLSPHKQFTHPKVSLPVDEDNRQEGIDREVLFHVGECLPFVVFANELCRGVAFFQEIQRERECEEMALFSLDPLSSPAASDPAKTICEPYFDWVRQTRRRTGEEEKQKHFFNMISSLAHDEREHMCSGEGNVGTDSIQTLKLVGYEYVSAMCEKIRSLELELCIADVAALDVIEFGVLAAATRAGKPGSDGDINSRWLRCLGYIQLQAYAEKNPQHSNVLSSFLSLTATRDCTPTASLSRVSFLSSISDPAVDPSLSNVIVSVQIDSGRRRARALSLSGVPRKLLKSDPQALNVMNKTLLEAVYPTIPGLLHTFSVPDLVLSALLYAQWSHCLMTETYWQLGWGSRPSSKRNILETLQASVMVLETKLVSVGNSIPKEHVSCFADVITTIISSLTTSFITCSVHDESQLGAVAKFDLKIALMTLEICHQLMKTLTRWVSFGAAGSKAKGCHDDDAGGWQEDVMRLCAFITVRVGSNPANTTPSSTAKTPPTTPSAISVVDGGFSNLCGGTDDESLGIKENSVIADDEFSDWDESDDEDESVTESPAGGEDRRSGTLSSGGGFVRRSSFRQHSSNASNSCFDTILIHNNMQEIESMLTS